MGDLYRGPPLLGGYYVYILCVFLFLYIVYFYFYILVILILYLYICTYTYMYKYKPLTFYRAGFGDLLCGLAGQVRSVCSFGPQARLSH